MGQTNILRPFNYAELTEGLHDEERISFANGVMAVEPPLHASERKTVLSFDFENVL